MAEKILPHDLEAEKAVLGAMLRDPDSVGPAFEVLGDNGFFHEGHIKIYQAIESLYIRSEPIDLYTVAEQLRGQGDLERVGGPSYLASLLHSVATSANLAYYARIVKDKAQLRILIQACLDTAESGFQQQGNSSLLIDCLQRQLLDMSRASKGKGFQHVGDILQEVVEKIQKVRAEKSRVTGLSTGYELLDDLTSGFQSSDLLILAARPSVGKTSLALNIAQNAVVEEHTPVGIFSLEMNAEEILERLLCGGARVNLSTLKNGWTNDEEFDRVVSFSGVLSSSPLYIDDSPNLAITDIFSRAVRLKAEEPELGLVILDYLQLITSPGRGGNRYENRQQEVAAYSRTLKSLARELDVPILVISQLSRASEKRNEDPAPRLSDLRDSGAIEQDADLVMFLYQERNPLKKFIRSDEEDETGEESQEESVLSLSIAKQRNGPRGVVKLYFCKEYTRFESLAPEQSQAPF